MPPSRLHVVLAAAVLPVAFLALVVPYLLQPGVRLDFDEDGPARLRQPHKACASFEQLDAELVL